MLIELSSRSIQQTSYVMRHKVSFDTSRLTFEMMAEELEFLVEILWEHMSPLMESDWGECHELYEPSSIFAQFVI